MMPPRTDGIRAAASPRKKAPGLDALAEQAAAAAGLLKLLANEHRLLILCLLSVRGETSVGELVAESGLSQSALSQHLARLRADGIVTFRRDAQTLYYRMADARAARVLERLKDIYCGHAKRGGK
jgi:ArsR family transcriptional regulator, virulence genes transcriptional regulator